jgi:GMP synthase (glutamine-hydrolysing)
MLIVLRAGDAIPSVAAKRGEFFRWIKEGVGDAWTGAWSEIDLRENAALPDPRAAQGFIVTGSASSVTERAPWMLRAQTWLADAVDADAAVLGICFGHQLLAEALGGHVIKNPRGREIGTVRVSLDETAARDPLFASCSSPMRVNATHVDTVAQLPKGAERLAVTSLDDNAAFRVRRAWGVQFHPEIDGELMRGYLVARRDAILSEGLPHDAMMSSAEDAPDALALMRSFARFTSR